MIGYLQLMADHHMRHSYKETDGWADRQKLPNPGRSGSRFEGKSPEIRRELGPAADVCPELDQGPDCIGAAAVSRRR